MMDSSQFTLNTQHFESLEPIETRSATCDTFRVKLYGKLHFLKRLKPVLASDIRYREALRKEFETGYRLEHPHLVRYVSVDDDSILMEYVDGETLTHRLANNPDYFKKRSNTDKFLRQFLDVISYLHSHQVLHLDLKPDNILLTRINNDLKLIDLGCCYTDTFTDTQGHTNGFAAPEQLNGEMADERTDIYAIGKILEQLPNRSIYNKVIGRCTENNPAKRYQSVEELQHDLSNCHPLRRYMVAAAVLLLVVSVGLFLILRPETTSNVVSRATTQSSIDTQISTKTIPQVPKNVTVQTVPSSNEDVYSSITQDPIDMLSSTRTIPPVPKNSVVQTSPSSQADNTIQMKKDLDRLIDRAYKTTISSFCDSVFPSPSVGKQWSQASGEFHYQILQIGAQLFRKYPKLEESTIHQEAESRFQSLVTYVFNRMRENGEKKLESKKDNQ